MDGPRSASPRTDLRPWLVAYLGAQSLLLIAAGVAGDPARAILHYVILGGGTIVFTGAVILRRPTPAIGWRVVVAASWLVIASVAAFAVNYGVGTHTSVRAIVPVVMAALPQPVFALGLALNSRSVARSGPVDGLDAAMVALVGFLLLWTFAIEPVLVPSPTSTAMAIVLPASTLLVVGLACRIMLGGGLRDPATAVLLGTVAILVALTVSKVTPTLGEGAYRETVEFNLLLSSYGLLLGSIGLLPSFGRPRRRPEPATTDLTGERLALFVILALIPLVAWTDQSLGQRPPRTGLVGVLVPIVTSAAFLALLITRLSMLARLAQRRSSALSVRAAEQEALKQDFEFQATHDPLTGLANRAALKHQLERGPARAGAASALLLLDIDNFKGINDTYGHQIGDDLLVQVARRLQSAAPPEAVVARLGGDEFVILAHDTDPAAATALAERCVDLFRTAYRIGDRELMITTSVGVVSMPVGNAAAYDQALHNADLALYAAKSAGKNQYVTR